MASALILLSLLGALPTRADPGVFDDRIVFGQSAALKGAASALGVGMREGYFGAGELESYLDGRMRRITNAID